MKPVVQLYRGEDRQWYLRVVASNGQVVLDSEGYTRKWSAKRAARRASGVFGGLRIVEVSQ